MSQPNKKKRLVFYMEAYTRGGAERYFCDLINGINLEKYEVNVFCNQDELFSDFVKQSILSKEIAVQIVKIRSLNTSKAVHLAKSKKIFSLANPFKGLLSPSLRYFYSLINLIRLYSIFKKMRIDILHINNGGYPGAESCRMAVFAAKLARIPIKIMTFHNIAMDFNRIFLVEKLIDRLLYAYTDVIITSSQASMLSLEKKRGWDLKKVKNIYNCIDILSPIYQTNTESDKKRNELGLAPGIHVVGMAGYFQLRKGHLYFLKAINRIKKDIPKVKYIIIGEGPEEKLIKDLAVQLNVYSDIIFLGWRKEFLELLSTFDILVMPSIDYESVPYVILDAMALGKPVIATSVGGLPEAVIDGITGKIVPPQNDDALANAIVILLKDPEKRKEMGIAGRTRIRQFFAINKMLGEIQSIYDEFIDLKNKRLDK